MLRFKNLYEMKKDIEWRVSRFDELSIYELYAILRLRGKVFVVEQNAPYLDMDDKDQKALHLHGYIDGHLIAYSRLFKAGVYFEEASVGRVVVDADYRTYGYGRQLLAKSLELMESSLNESSIRISAQLYLRKFYESYGFVAFGNVYLEDGLPHICMKKH